MNLLTISCIVCNVISASFLMYFPHCFTGLGLLKYRLLIVLKMIMGSDMTLYSQMWAIHISEGFSAQQSFNANTAFIRMCSKKYFASLNTKPLFQLEFKAALHWIWNFIPLYTIYKAFRIWKDVFTKLNVSLRKIWRPSSKIGKNVSYLLLHDKRMSSCMISIFLVVSKFWIAC